MVMVLGLDQSPKGAGFCLGNGDGAPTFGYRSFPEFGNNEALLIREIRQWLTTLCKSSGVEAIFTEEVLAGRPLNVPILLKKCCVYAAVATVAGDLNIDDYAAPISAWRSWFIGGTPPKEFKGAQRDWWKKKAILECTERNWYVENDHVAEACGIWSFGLQQIDPIYRHRARPDHRRAQSRREAERIG